jgi:hypothetical protein
VKLPTSTSIVSMFLNFTSMLFGLGWMNSIAAPGDCDRTENLYLSLF